MHRRTLLLGLIATLTALPAAAADTVILENARVFDGRQDLGVVDVVLQGERILQVGRASDAQRSATIPRWARSFTAPVPVSAP